jgi:fermentation-respiration switch protein FrsA (DUF1100 family)
VLRPALNQLLYFPDRSTAEPPEGAEDLWAETPDGEGIHGWWFRSEGRAHLIFCHGNGGNVLDRVPLAQPLARAGVDVLLWDYRGYGRSSGRPDEEGTYTDARAVRDAVLARDGVDPDRLVLLGESLGGAVALKLASEHPPAGLILQSTFTSVRDVARQHYPFIPAPLVPDAYPSKRLVRDLRAPLLVMHGDRDEIVPFDHGRALYDAAPEPKRFHTFAGAGHNDIDAGEWAAAIDDWLSEAVA